MREENSIGLYSLNCKGLGNEKKRRQVFRFLGKKNQSSIMLLQETHSTKSVEKLWQNEWGYRIIFSHGSSNCRGVCILFKNNFDLELHKCYSDNYGRFVIADITAEGKKYTIVNLYAPNEDNPEFFCSIFCALRDFECESLVIGGDVNCVLNPV